MKEINLEFLDINILMKLSMNIHICSIKNWYIKDINILENYMIEIWAYTYI